MRDELLAEAGDGHPLALKDPRIGVLMPLWWPLLENVLHPVLVLRDPLEVALSLERRYQTALPVALAMWELNITRTLVRLNGEVVTIVRYREMVEAGARAGHAVRDASRHLRPEVASAVRPDLASSAFDPQLYRNRAEELAGNGWLDEHQRRLSAYLDSLASGTIRLQAPQWVDGAPRESLRLTGYERRRQEERNGMGARLEQAALDMAERDRALREHQDALRERERELDEMTARARDLEARCAEALQQLDGARGQLSEAEHWLTEIQQSLSWRATEPLRSLARAARR